MTHIYHYFAGLECEDWWNDTLSSILTDPKEINKMLCSHIRKDLDGKRTKEELENISIRIRLAHPAGGLIEKVCGECCSLRRMKAWKEKIYDIEYPDPKGFHCFRIREMIGERQYQVCKDCWEQNRSS